MDLPQLARRALPSSQRCPAREQVAQIITFGTLAAKAAIKDVGRVLDMSFAEVDRISKLVPRTLNIKLEQAIEDPELKVLAAKEPKVKEVLDVSMRLEGVWIIVVLV